MGRFEMITKALAALSKEPIRMPGTKAKQAKALAFNIKWMGETFGVERLGFLTLTVGDTVNGRFVNVKARAEASRRFNSILNRIRERYRCGVVVTERHKNGGIHFHLVVVLPFDARTGFDFEAVKRRDYRSVSKSLRDEWAWWRDNQDRYGFGRHELMPVKSNEEAIGRYVAKYLSKSWEERTDDDYGGRCVRYFGRWSASGVKCGPPMSARHGAMTPRAQAWRECLKQVQFVTKQLGAEVNEQNIKENNGPRWAWRFTRQIQSVRFVVPKTRGSDALRQGIAEHNESAAPSEDPGGCYRPKTIGVWDTDVDWWWAESRESQSRRYVRAEVDGRRYAVAWRREERKRAALDHAFNAAMVYFESLAADDRANGNN